MPSVGQQLQPPMIGAQTDKVVGLDLGKPIDYRAMPTAIRPDCYRDGRGQIDRTFRNSAVVSMSWPPLQRLGG
jgi:hypothetical protein